MLVKANLCHLNDHMNENAATASSILSMTSTDASEDTIGEAAEGEVINPAEADVLSPNDLVDLQRRLTV